MLQREEEDRKEPMIISYKVRNMMYRKMKQQHFVSRAGIMKGWTEIY